MIRIVVRCPNWVGDAILATPTLSLLRRSFPGAEITVIGRPNAKAVLENNPDIDALWIVQDKGLGDFLKLVRRIRREKFDLAILLPNSFRCALAFAFAGVPKRIGYAVDGRSFLLTHPVDMNIFHMRCHMVEYYINILEDLESCNLEDFERRLALSPGAEGRDEIESVLAKHGLNRNQFIAAISPGAAAGASKCWLPDRFAQVADVLAEEHGAKVVLVGAPPELPLCKEIAGQCKSTPEILCGEITLGGMIALCERIGLMVTNDCGAMHIATAMKTPLVAIFGPTNLKRTAPYDPEASIVERIADCGCDVAPCYELAPQYKGKCPIQRQCMTAVTVEDVAAAIEKQIQRLRARS
jgi:heptosyltransferase-2